MDWLQIVILGIVQGVTEFLPVSSSGHLVIGQALFKDIGLPPLPNVLEVNIFLHAGTLGAIVAFYWRQILRLLTEDRRVIGKLVVGTLPAVIVGLPLKMYAPGVLESALLSGIGLIATGGMLIWCGRRGEAPGDYQQITYLQSALIGCFQALAILPGLSRSGWTIAGGLWVGLRREAAATFSFLLAIPAIAGSTVLEIGDLLAGNAATPVGVLAAGAAVAFVVGFFSLQALVMVIRHGKLQWFAWWCIPLGLAVTIWQLAVYPV